MRHQLLTALYSVCSVACVAFSANAAQEVMGQQNEPPHEMQDMIDAPASTPVSKTLPVARNGEVIDSIGSGATETTLPVVQESNGIRYITGGVSDEEEDAMKSQEPDFNVRILISSTQGEYMSEVAIRFLDKQNAEVLRVNNAGPFFYVNLPPGTYTAEAASTSGAIQKVKVVVPAKAKASGIINIRFNE